MNKIIIFLFFLYIIYLIYESYKNNMNRDSFTHVIHVNGTRGKSSTARLIDAALRDGDYKVFCKTTGTSPRTIDVNGIEEPIVRKGKANIKEQIKIIRKAYEQKADILIVECMAVDPELQYVTQNKILKADIGIITNARRDHLEVMGPTLKDVAISLGNIMPENGTLITAEKKFIDYYRELGDKSNSKVILARDLDDDFGIDFNDNVSIALEVCNILGINEDIAIERIRKNYKKDPGVLTNYSINLDNNIEANFINGLAINDPDSIKIIYEKYNSEGLFSDKQLILLVNNREDRSHRMIQHIDLIYSINPQGVWIAGDNKRLMKNRLIKAGFPKSHITIIDDNIIDMIGQVSRNTVIFAIGNIGDNGEEIIKYINEVGEKAVQFNYFRDYS